MTGKIQTLGNSIFSILTNLTHEGKLQNSVTELTCEAASVTHLSNHTSTVSGYTEKGDDSRVRVKHSNYIPEMTVASNPMSPIAAWSSSGLITEGS